MSDSSSLSLLGSHFIGVILTCLFYGITLAQTRNYYRTYQNDPLYMKILVGILWSLDTTQLWLVTCSAYEYAVVNKGDFYALSHVTVSFEVSMAITSIIAFIVQMIYAYRIWHISQHNISLTSAIILLALVALASGGAMMIKTVRDSRWDHTSVSNLPASFILVATVACDALIAGSQVFFFHASRTMHGRLGNLLTKLTLLVVNVGLLTSIDATVFLILFLACPLNGFFIVPYLLLSNCYLNSFLSVLNSRHLLRTLLANDPDEYSTPTLRPDNAESVGTPPLTPRLVFAASTMSLPI